MEKTMDKIVALCNARGFIYPGSQIYGGLSNTWDAQEQCQESMVAEIRAGVPDQCRR